MSTLATAQTLKINEVQYDPSGSEVNGEWVEFYVSAGGDVDPLRFTTRDGETAYNFPSLTVSAGEFIVLHVGAGTNDLTGPTYHLYWGQSSSRFVNTGDDLNLCTSATCSSGTCSDYVAYGSGGVIDRATGGCSWDGTSSTNPESSVEGTTIAQGPDGADGDTYATWEQAGAAGGPTTFGPDTQGASNTSDPTPVRYRSVQARWREQGALIEWQTTSEIHEAGFLVMRDRPGAPDLELVPGGRRPALGGGRGTSYAVFDSDAQPGDRYVLRSLAADGRASDFAPVAVDWHEALPSHWDDWVDVRAENEIELDRPPPRFLPGDVVRIVAPTEHLVAVNLPPSATALPLRLEHHGKPIPHWIDRGRLVFYSAAQPDPRRHGVVYLLHVGAEGAPDSPDVFAGPQGDRVTQRTHVVERMSEDLRYYVAAPPEAEDNFYWDFTATDMPLEGLTLPVRSAVGGPMRLRLAVAGAIDEPNVAEDHHLVAYLNGQAIMDVHFAGISQRVFEVELNHAETGSGSLSLDFRIIEDTGILFDLVLLDWVELEYDAKIEAQDGEAVFHAETGATVTVKDLEADVWLLDVTDEDTPRRLRTQQNVVDSGLAESEPMSFGAASATGCSCALGVAPGVRPPNVSALGDFMFTDPRALGLRRYFATSKIVSPWSVGLAQGARVLAADSGADWIAIADPLLIDATESLASVHAQEGLSTWVVGMDEVADGFGYGEATPEAIAAFLAHAWERWQIRPRYVVLAGQASFDPQGRLGGTFPDRVPVTRFPTSGWNFEAADDGVVVEGLANPPAVGRLAAATAEEVQAVADKIQRRSQLSRRALLVVDSGFEAEADLVDEMMGHRLPIERLEEATMSSPGERVAQALNDSPALTLYVGHAFQRGWGMFFMQEHVALLTQPAGLVISLDCFDGMFDDAFGPAIAWTMVGSPGGPIAAWAPSSIGGVLEHRAIAQVALDELFSGRHQTVGAALAAAEARLLRSTTNPTLRDVLRSYNLLGDPATPITALF